VVKKETKKEMSKRKDEECEIEEYLEFKELTVTPMQKKKSISYILNFYVLYFDTSNIINIKIFVFNNNNKVEKHKTNFNFFNFCQHQVCFVPGRALLMLRFILGRHLLELTITRNFPTKITMYDI
jgi:ABC-type uncharacterized transport system fused permease/ATPase subunit